jgi:hypothetical protein
MKIVLHDPYIGFAAMLLVGVLVEVAVFYGLRKMFPKVPVEVWFLTGTFVFMAWFFLCTLAGMA